MIGAITTPLLWGTIAAVALRPPLPARSTPFNLQFAFTWWINEVPVLGLWLVLLGSGQTVLNPAPTSPIWWAATALTVAAAAILARLLLRGRSAKQALTGALQAVYGQGAAPRYTRPPWWRIVILPVLSWRPGVTRRRNLAYGPDRRHRLDVYSSRAAHPRNAPALIYFHPGGFVMGSKALGAHPLLYRLAAEGWVCITANYRLRGAQYSDQLDDARAVVRWVRDNAGELGIDPGTIVLAGGSAGAHLAATTALTGAGVQGVIAMYGYYGAAGGEPPNSPADVIHPGAPPFFIIHGELDPLVLSKDARAFATRLREVSRRPVAYAQLPGANHNFDFFPSVRFQAVVDAIVCFADQQHPRPGA